MKYKQYIHSYYDKKGNRPAEYVDNSTGEVNGEINTIEGPFLATFGYIESNTRHLEGRLLTLMEAIFSEKDQLKAVKDQVRLNFAEYLKEMSEILQETTEAR